MGGCQPRAGCSGDDPTSGLVVVWRIAAVVGVIPSVSIPYVVPLWSMVQYSTRGIVYKITFSLMQNHHTRILWRRPTVSERVCPCSDCPLPECSLISIVSLS